MNKRQVIILWIIAIALGSAVGLLKLTQKDTTKSATNRAAGQTLFESFPGTDVTAVEIKGATGVVNLVRKDGKWTVAERDGYPANATYINEFIRTLSELKITRGMEAGPSFAPRFGMDESAGKAEDRGLTATFKDSSGKELAKVSLGKNIESGAAEASPFGGGGAVGRYIRNHADESGFYAISEMFPSVSDDVTRWLNDGFFSPEKIKSISLSKKATDESAWKLSRESEEAEFKLEGATGDEVLDTTATSPLKSLFSYARFNDVIPAGKAEERRNAAEKRSAVIETFEGFIYSLTITPAKPAKPAEGETSTASADDVLLTVRVNAELPKERKKEENEKPEDAKSKDEAFTSRIKSLTEKLEKEKALEGRVFLLPKTSVDALMKERDQLITKAQPAPAADASKGSVQTLPGGIVTTPASSPVKTATSPPVEAVTPPIAIPPQEDAKPEEKKSGE